MWRPHTHLLLLCCPPTATNLLLWCSLQAHPQLPRAHIRGLIEFKVLKPKLRASATGCHPHDCAHIGCTQGKKYASRSLLFSAANLQLEQTLRPTVRLPEVLDRGLFWLLGVCPPLRGVQLLRLWCAGWSGWSPAQVPRPLSPISWHFLELQFPAGNVAGAVAGTRVTEHCLLL